MDDMDTTRPDYVANYNYYIVQESSIMKNLMRSLLVGLLTVGLVSTASAALITVTDVVDDDLNIIDEIIEDSDGSILTLKETYAEDDLVPYPSRNGYAVVDITDEGEIRWFDKLFEFEQGEDTTGWTFEFEVTNQTPWHWSDYHFVFYDTEFENRLDFTDILVDWSNTVVFQNSEFSSGSGPDDIKSELEFWKPAYHRVGDTHTYTLNFSDTNPLPTEFGIRQIATVSEPVSLALFGLGLAGLGLMRRRRV